VVVDDVTAFSLYNTYDAVGQSLLLAGEEFKIIGVISTDLSRQPSVYIPMKVMERMSTKPLPITNIEILALNSTINSVEEALRTVGVDHETFVIEDARIEGQ